jgi:hypothetical protein
MELIVGSGVAFRREKAPRSVPPVAARGTAPIALRAFLAVAGRFFGFGDDESLE